MRSATIYIRLMNTTHEFETTEGDELLLTDLRDATWRVVETFVDLDIDDNLVFTHRIEVHMFDDQILGERR